jgi:hypothetical protein
VTGRGEVEGMAPAGISEAPCDGTVINVTGLPVTRQSVDMHNNQPDTKCFIKHIVGLEVTSSGVTRWTHLQGNVSGFVFLSMLFHLNVSVTSFSVSLLSLFFLSSVRLFIAAETSLTE